VRAPLPILGTILLAGCLTHPATAPHPQTVVAAGAPVSRMTPDSAHPAPAKPATTTTKIGTWTTEVSKRDVARRAIEVFGDSLITATPKVEEEAEPTWDMDVRSYETQDRVAYYVNMFSGRSRERIADRLERGTRYEPMIRAKMKAGGLPEDMYYLALVESGFDPNAYSKAAAVGMWQFMTSTARDMGMRVDWWVDERRDPVRSTSAAVRFIRGLRDQFGSLYLAAAAYNGGPGRVSRGLARYADDLENTAGDDAFFVLAEKDYLRNETREYVPQLIAAALIAKEPTRYGMSINTLAPLAYDSVRVPPSTPLAAIAKASHASTRDIVDLNPHLLRGMTPPRDTYQVRIPPGAATSFDSAFAALPDADRTATHRIETKKGDRAEGIARQHGISVTALEGFNPNLRRLKPSGKLVPGQVLVIPTPAVASASLAVPDPAIERFPNSTSRMKVHTVRRGETMGSIARRYGTTPARLMQINGLRKPVIFPGQTLLLSGNAARASKSAKAAKGRAAAAKSTKAAKGRSAVSKAPSRERASKAVSRKRSGTGSKAGARTKSKTAKGEARAN
jgi:membrane-bound lytic murein transglycosylase D